MLGSVGTLLLLASVVGAAPYSKFGRSCKDIGCLNSEVCVMAEEPCTYYSQNQCGRYPTCKKMSESGGQSCTTMICPSGQYCKTENGKPTCVNTVPNIGYETSGVFTVNGHRTSNSEEQGLHSPNSNTHSNPFANANAPPAVPDNSYPVNSGSNLGYPPYPSNAGGSSSNAAYNPASNSNGYPAYPPNQGSTNLGYPPYPTQNRMPVPGQPYPQSNYPVQPQPGYPQQNGYPTYANNGQRYHSYPGYQNIPYQSRGYSNNANTGYRRNGADATLASSLIVCLGLAILATYTS